MRVVVQPEQGEGTIINASIIQQSIRELTNAHPVTSGQLAEFQRVDPNPQYGDPTSNVVVLESPFVNLAGHNGTYQVDVTVSYVVATGNPPPNNWQTINPPPVSMTLTMNNLVLVDSRSEPYFVWKPLEVAPPPQPRNVLIEDPVSVGPTVPFSVQIQHAQSGVCTLRLEIFTSENNQTPILVKQFTNVPRPGVWQWEWDGKLADGSTAPRGIYLYRLSAEAYVPTLPDRDSNRSDYLFIQHALDAGGAPILEVEYLDYDDKNTDDENDDETLYLLQYVLKDGYAMNATSGRIQLFDPDLNMVYSWDVAALRCVEHNEATDGLRADSTGIKHGLVLRVPLSVMGKGGVYRFLIQMADDHANLDKCHRQRQALPLNCRRDLLPIVYIEHGGYHIAWCRREATETVLKLYKRAEPRAAINWCAEVTNSQIRSATNGGFFNMGVTPPKAIGEYADGQWSTDHQICSRHRFCFGFEPNRRRFGVDLMLELNRSTTQPIRFKPKPPQGNKQQPKYFVVHPRIRDSYQYGLANVGLLVWQGQAQSAEPNDNWPDANIRRERTAIAWAAINGRDHVWLITTSSATWDEVAQFVEWTLPGIMWQQFKVQFRKRDLNAMMLDGGSSTQFAYRRKDRRGTVVQSESNGAPQSDNRTIHNIIGAHAPWRN